MKTTTKDANYACRLDALKTAEVCLFLNIGFENYEKWEQQQGMLRVLDQVCWRMSESEPPLPPKRYIYY